ncbi:tetratricopeptide repeat protein [Streptomyces sp. NPDC041068]|uniref:tetratricopeptide repeat protein n=1 Tax=Streptomyces sp. NPDC041068 TaxID=3155130 RepID=UPI0033FFFCD9
MTSDRHGHRLTDTGDEAAGHLERAVDHLLFFRPQVEEAIADALTAAPRSPIAQAFSTYLALLGTEPSEADAARTRFQRYRSDVDITALPARERGHMEAAQAWLDGDMHRAGLLLADLTVAHPHDTLALAVGHQIDFFTGDAVSLRDRIGAALATWDAQDPHYGPLLGMYAFGLEEAGHYDRSEEIGLRAVETNARDVWGIHATVHTYEMQGRFVEGIRYLNARTDDWTSGNYLTVHNWWHYALFALEADATERAEQVYDAAIRPAGSCGTVMELLDASALLWRFLLAGIDQGPRWQSLAAAWEERHDPSFYAFNDVHAVMAYAGAGRVADAEALIRDRQA